MKIIEEILSASQSDTVRLLKSRKARNPEVCQRLLRKADQTILSTPRDGLPIARLGTRLAHSLPGYYPGAKCLKARSFAVLGSAHRATGRYDAARKAFELSERYHSCDQCRADLHRRRSYLCYAEGNPLNALDEAELAMEIYQRVGDQNGEAKTLVARSMWRYLSDALSIEEALEDARAALFKLNKDETTFRIAALHNISVLLARSNSLLRVLAALALIPRLRRHLKGVEKISVERAKMKWFEGNLCARARLFGKAEKYLETARNQLIELGLKHDIAAVTADLMKAKYPDRNGIRAACRTALPFVLPEHADMLKAILTKEDNLMTLIDQLREKATCGLMPQPWTFSRLRPGEV